MRACYILRQLRMKWSSGGFRSEKSEVGVLKHEVQNRNTSRGLDVSLLILFSGNKMESFINGLLLNIEYEMVSFYWTSRIY